MLKPLVLKYFSWVKKQKENPLISPESETAKGLNDSIHQEKYLLEELPKYWNGYKKEFEKTFLKNLLPWSEQLSSEIRKTEK